MSHLIHFFNISFISSASTPFEVKWCAASFTIRIRVFLNLIRKNVPSKNGEDKDGKYTFTLWNERIHVCCIFALQNGCILPHFHFAFMQTEQLSIHPEFTVHNFSLSISLIEYICKRWNKNTFVYSCVYFSYSVSSLNDNCVISRSDRCTVSELGYRVH